jgi:hypothetical protein
MSPYLSPVVDAIREHCGHVDKAWAGRHTRLRWTNATGAKWTETLALSPRTDRSLRNALAQVRRRARQVKEQGR